MKITVDDAGRVELPKPLRESFRLESDSIAEITRESSELNVFPGVRIIEGPYGRLAFDSSTVITDEIIYGLRDEGRK